MTTTQHAFSQPDSQSVAPEHGGTRRWVLITGAGRRIGRELALSFASQGWGVYIHYRNSRADAAEVAEMICAGGGEARLLQQKLDGAADAAQLFRLCAGLGPLPACIINNASLFEYDNASAIDSALFERAMQTNLLVPLALAQAFFEARKQADSATMPEKRLAGCVINLLDQKIDNLNPDYFSYTLSKCALRDAIRMQAMALAPELRVVGLAPGLTLVSGRQNDDDFSELHQTTPLGRGSMPPDIAQAALYLANAAAVTGTVLTVDGGQCLLPQRRDLM